MNTTHDAYTYVNMNFPTATNKNELVKAYEAGAAASRLDPHSCDNQLKLLKSDMERLRNRWLSLHNHKGKKPLPLRIGLAKDNFCEVEVEHYAEHFAEEDDIRVIYHIKVGYEDFAVDETAKDQITRLRKAARWMLQLAGWMEARIGRPRKRR